MIGSGKRALIAQICNFHYGSKYVGRSFWGKVILLQHSYLWSLIPKVKPGYSFLELNWVMLIVFSIHHYTVCRILQSVSENHCEHHFETQSCVSLEWKLLLQWFNFHFDPCLHVVLPHHINLKLPSWVIRAFSQSLSHITSETISR